MRDAGSSRIYPKVAAKPCFQVVLQPARVLDDGGFVDTGRVVGEAGLDVIVYNDIADWEL